MFRQCRPPPKQFARDHRNLTNPFWDITHIRCVSTRFVVLVDRHSYFEIKKHLFHFHVVKAQSTSDTKVNTSCYTFDCMHFSWLWGTEGCPLKIVHPLSRDVLEIIFNKFHGPFGWYCSYCAAQLLNGTSDRKQNKTLWLSGRCRL